MQKQLAIKVGVIIAIAIFILVPLSLVKSKIHERQRYLEEAKAAVTASWTGPQLVMTPVIVIPYTQSAVPADSGFYPDSGNQPGRKIKILVPEDLRLEATVDNKTLHKGIYDIPVYSSQLTIAASYSDSWLQQKMAEIQQAKGASGIEKPYIALYISDVRGIDSEPQLTVNGEQLKFQPKTRLRHLPSGIHAPLPEAALLGGDLNLSISLSLRGLESLLFAPLGDVAELSLQSNWPHPEFIGTSLPGQRSINAQGFKAKWQATQYSNGNRDLLSACMAGERCQKLLGSAFGVRFIDPVDIYLQSERSVKYAMLFIGLSFISFFIFEMLKRLRIHPIQYTFVGLAIAIFYLLLISLAEHIAFSAAYSIAVICCTTLLLFYVRYMLRSLASSLVFSSMIAGLYGMLYVIIQAEDFALLMGSALVFSLLAVAMFVTRNMDWYELGEETTDQF